MGVKYWNGVEVYLTVGGERLSAYEDLAQTAGVLEYVQTQREQNFDVVVRLPKTFSRCDADRLRCTLLLDGKRVKSTLWSLKYMSRKDNFLVGQINAVLFWNETRNTWVEKRFKVAGISIYDDQHFDFENTKELGSLIVKLSRRKLVKGSRNEGNNDQGPRISTETIPEQVPKGRRITNRISLGASTPIETRYWFLTEALKGPQSEPYTVELRYETRSQLQELGFLPPDEEAIAVDDQEEIAAEPAAMNVINFVAAPTLAVQPKPVVHGRLRAMESASRTPIGRPPSESSPVLVQVPDGTKVEASEQPRHRVLRPSLHARLEYVDRELALLRERERLQAKIAAEEHDVVQIDTPVKLEQGGVRPIKREGNAAGRANRAAKRPKAEFVDLTDE